MQHGCEAGLSLPRLFPEEEAVLSTSHVGDRGPWTSGHEESALGGLGVTWGSSQRWGALGVSSSLWESSSSLPRDRPPRRRQQSRAERSKLGQGGVQLDEARWPLGVSGVLNQASTMVVPQLSA